MPMQLKREIREGEVRAILSADGQTCIAIVKRSDGLFWCFEDILMHDREEDVRYWSAMHGPLSGLYGTIEEAERDARSLLAR
jgi:hypothetical protein